MKDKEAVTTQWFSFLHGDAARLDGADLPNLEVLEVGHHPNKLRTGHLRGNRFALRLREVRGGETMAREILDHLVEEGCPNYFGTQRFGHDNLANAMAWLSGERRVKDRFKKKLYASVVQSAVFNEVVAQRLRLHSLRGPLAGDVFRKEDSGGLFTSPIDAELEARLDAFEISPTGPMLGPKMKPCENDAQQLEEAVLEPLKLSATAQETLFRNAPGTRRSVRFRPLDVELEPQGSDLWVRFSLPKGCYATSLMREVQGDVES